MLMSANDRAAKLQYQHNGFRVLSPGTYVLCAVTGDRIALEALRYWNVDRQEAYGRLVANQRWFVSKDSQTR